jgi:hypothetical protein
MWYQSDPLFRDLATARHRRLLAAAAACRKPRKNLPPPAAPSLAARRCSSRHDYDYDLPQLPLFQAAAAYDSTTKNRRLSR